MKLKCLAKSWVLLLGLASVSAQSALAANVAKKEEIYILRSVRTSRISPTNYCAQSRTGFSDPLVEDQYVFHAVTTDSDHGTVVEAFGAKTASAHACFGKTSDPDVMNFYAEGEIAGLRFTGRGECTTVMIP